MAERKGRISEREERLYRRVVVTTMAAISPLGLDIDSTWEKVKNSESGISSIESTYPNIAVAGEVSGFNPAEALKGLIPLKDLKKLSRAVQFATAASYAALRQGNYLDDNRQLLPTFDSTRFGVQIGTGIGGALEITEAGERLKKGLDIRPSDSLRIELERVSSVVSLTFGLQGPLETPSAACATGNMAILGALKEILLGEADLMLCGGTEASIHPISFALYDASRAMSREKNPSRASRPFDKKRSGFVMSEGAGILILEEYEHAKKRGAPMLAEVVGFANTADAFHDTEPSGEGAKRAMLETLKKSSVNLSKDEIYINAHGTATIKGDPAEILAIKEVFGSDSKIYASSTKSSLGHLMGAAGAIEAILCIKALQEGVIPPTINLEEPIDESQGINLIPNDAQLKPVRYAMNNSFGFGGINSVILFKAFED